MTKYNIRLVKSIYTPVEIEAENMHEALKKAFAMMPETDLDHGDCKYTVDFTPENMINSPSVKIIQRRCIVQA